MGKVDKNDKIDQKAFGARLAQARIRQSMTQEQFAEAVEISKNYVSDMERGKKMPSWGKMVRICDVLEESIDHLVCDSSRQGLAFIQYETLECLSALDQPTSRRVLEIVQKIVLDLLLDEHGQQKGGKTRK